MYLNNLLLRKNTCRENTFLITLADVEG